jgi:nucleotide-binding universal stress UspA family protein
MSEPAETVDVPDGAVVVGVDGSECSSKALRWAAEDARRRDVPLVVVRAWNLTTAPRLAEFAPGYVPSLQECEQAVRVEIKRQVREALGEDPQIEVSLQPVHERPAQALIAASERASSVVVGSRGRGGFRGLLLGSVSDQMVRHSNCPVTVVRDKVG